MASFGLTLTFGVMKKCLVYYPGSVPCLGWLKSSLLYYDELASVFPAAAFVERLADEPSTGRERGYSPAYGRRLEAVNWLREQGLFTPLLATDLLDRPAKKRLLREYKQALKTADRSVWSDTLLRVFDQYSPYRLAGPVFPGDDPDAVIQVLTDWLGQEDETVVRPGKLEPLIDQGLWLLMRLTRENANGQGRQWLPSTCQPDYQDLLFAPAEPAAEGARLVIDSCLPIPKPNTPLPAILAFKEKYEADLRNLRSLTDTFISDLVQKVHEDGVLPLLLELEEQLFAALRGLNTALRHEGIDTLRTSWESLISLEGAATSDVFNRLRQVNGNLIYQAGGQKKRVLKLVRTSLPPENRDDRRLGQFERGHLLVCPHCRATLPDENAAISTTASS